MESISEIKTGKRIKVLATEADLILYKGKLYKLFNSTNNLKLKISILDELYDRPIDNCTKINEILYDDTLLGYSMPYYKDYTEAGRINAPLKLKKIYTRKLIDIYRELKQRGFVFYDFHDGNVLVKRDELVLVDIDSCIELSNENDILGTRYLNELILSNVFGCNLSICKAYYGKQKYEQINECLYSDLSYTYKEKGSLDELDDYIQSINKTDVKNMQKKINRILTNH